MVGLTCNDNTALRMLLTRLSWPVKMVRLQSAKALRSLIVDVETREATTNGLLLWMKHRQFESEVLSALSVFATLPEDALPDLVLILENLLLPSIPAEAVLGFTYGFPGLVDWTSCHSGTPSVFFGPSDYFDKFKAAHVPRIFSHNIEWLEDHSGCPFTLQWAFEWEQLTNSSGAGKTNYPHYLGDFGLQRDGVTGQFIQRQGEVFRSAYLRTLAFAYDQWGIAEGDVRDFAMDAFVGVPDLFELTPQSRPVWLGSLPDACVAEGAAFAELGQSIVKAGSATSNVLVHLGTPFSTEIAEFGDLMLTAYLASPDFAIDGASNLPVRGEFENKPIFAYSRPRERLEIKPLAGSSGSAIPICSGYCPRIHGYWHDDYQSRGLVLPAAYCYTAPGFQEVDAQGLWLRQNGKRVAGTQYWHDAWSPLQFGDTPTRCGIETKMLRIDLDAAARKFDLKLGYLLEASWGERERSYGDLELRTKQEFFFVD